jgi:hypothetical protein
MDELERKIRDRQIKVLEEEIEEVHRQWESAISDEQRLMLQRRIDQKFDQLKKLKGNAKRDDQEASSDYKESIRINPNHDYACDNAQNCIRKQGVYFRSLESKGSLRTIQIFGIPSTKLSNGEYVVTDISKSFFDDLIVKKLFQRSCCLPDCDFEYLKIWLYDLDVDDSKREYDIPKLDERDLKIKSTFSSSKLESIYVLDNGLSNDEYILWKKTVKELFSPLFINFVAPPTPSKELANNPLFKLVESFTDPLKDSLDPYGKMKQNLFFNALIIQID